MLQNQNKTNPKTTPLPQRYVIPYIELIIVIKLPCDMIFIYRLLSVRLWTKVVSPYIVLHACSEEGKALDI